MHANIASDVVHAYATQYATKYATPTKYAIFLGGTLWSACERICVSELRPWKGGCRRRGNRVNNWKRLRVTMLCSKNTRKAFDAASY
jgi:hypothetical protein